VIALGTTIQIAVPVGADLYIPSSGLSRLPNYRSIAPPARSSARAAP
jgi:hypothetical protein